MDFAQLSGREEDEDSNSHSRRPSFTLTTSLPRLPPPSSSSTSSSSPTSWSVPGVQIEVPTDDQQGSSGAVVASLPAASVEKEHMFDKVVTPSDVGKLNRLVIPKQHAEKYFPLDSSTNEKGLLLNFEDRNGKSWRFRYSYWNSSQSYVMTKGWSRFVKEKRLDAGDTVSFGRGVGEAGRDRLFIDWKRRPEAQNPPNIPRIPIHGPYSPMMSFARSVVPWAGGRLCTPSTPVMAPVPSYDHRHIQGSSYSTYGTGNPYHCLRSAAVGGPSHSQYHPGLPVPYVCGGSSSGEGSTKSPIVFESVPVAHSTISTNSKRMRLFGVNVDCPPSRGDGGADPGTAAPQVRPLLSLQLGLGEHISGSAAGADMPDPSADDRPRMSLEFDE